ncbi:hypothetical protein [Hymenobacter daeguensis]
MVITSTVLLLASLYIATINSESNRLASLLTIAMLSGALVFSLFRNMKRQRVLFESMCLTIDDGQIIRTQHDTPTKRLSAAEIVRIERLATGVFVIKAARAADMIWMPAQVEQPDQLAHELSLFSPVVPMPAPAWYKTYASLIGLLVLPIMYLFYTTSSKAITALTGIVLIGSLAYSQWIIRRSKDLDNSVRRASWAIWPVLLSFLVALVAKLLQ